MATFQELIFLLAYDADSTIMFEYSLSSLANDRFSLLHISCNLQYCLNLSFMVIRMAYVLHGSDNDFVSSLEHPLAKVVGACKSSIDASYHFLLNAK